MNRTRRNLMGFCLCGALALGVVEASAESDEFLPVSRPGTFHFDVEDGYFQEFRIPVDCRTNVVRGTVHLTRYGKPTTEFSPGVNIYLQRGPDEQAIFAKLGFHAKAFHAPFEVTLSHGDAKTAASPLTYAHAVGDGDTFAFELRWTETGAVRASAGAVPAESSDETNNAIAAPVGSESHDTAMEAAPEVVHVIGFSGAGTVDLELGSVGPTDCVSNAV